MGQASPCTAIGTLALLLGQASPCTAIGTSELLHCYCSAGPTSFALCMAGKAVLRVVGAALEK